MPLFKVSPSFRQHIYCVLLGLWSLVAVHDSRDLALDLQLLCRSVWTHPPALENIEQYIFTVQIQRNIYNKISIHGGRYISHAKKTVHHQLNVSLPGSFQLFLCGREGAGM